jgi:RNA polymerase sigma factor (sigma-70 family)
VPEEADPEKWILPGWNPRPGARGVNIQEAGPPAVHAVGGRPTAMRSRDTSLGGPGVNFAETAWGMVERARDGSPQVRQGGLDDLARSYWKPVYHYLRVAWRKSNEDAKDLTQAFFLWLADRDVLGRYAPERGSFRAFLKSLVKHFVQHQDEALDRLKRGGGRVILSLNEEFKSLEGITPDPKAVDPEEIFEREWRNTLMAGAVERVRQRLLGDGTAMKFRVFEQYYLKESPDGQPTYARIADDLGLKEGDVKHYLVDVREEVRKEIRAQIERTVSGRDDLEEEWHAFFGP